MGRPKRPRDVGPADIDLPTATLGAALTSWKDSIDLGLASVALDSQVGAVTAMGEGAGLGLAAVFEREIVPAGRLIQERLIHGAMSAGLASIESWRTPLLAWAESLRWYQGSIADTLAFALESIRPALRILRGIDWRRRLCWSALQAVHDGDLEELRYFAYRVLRKPARYAHAVAGTDLEDDWVWVVGEALREMRWATADDPVAYLQTTAEGIAWRRYAADHLRGPGGEIVSLDRPVTLAGDPLAALIPDGRDDFAEIDARLDVWLICRQAELTADELQLIEVRCRGVTRQAAPAALGWPARKVEAVWRSTNRKFWRWKARRAA